MFSKKKRKNSFEPLFSDFKVKHLKGVFGPSFLPAIPMNDLKFKLLLLPFYSIL